MRVSNTHAIYLEDMWSLGIQCSVLHGPTNHPKHPTAVWGGRPGSSRVILLMSCLVSWEMELASSWGWEASCLSSGGQGTRLWRVGLLGQQKLLGYETDITCPVFPVSTNTKDNEAPFPRSGELPVCCCFSCLNSWFPRVSYCGRRTSCDLKQYYSFYYS